MDLTLVTELIFILFGAFVGGVVATKLKQPLVVGYIFAGLLLGAVVPFIKDSSHAVSTLAEIGVALLLFTLGLEFSLDRLKKVGKPAVVGAILQMTAVTAIFTAIVAIFFNQPLNVAVFVGVVFSLSSTAVVAKILSERGETESSHGDLIMAWLIVQDLAVVPIMLVVPILTSGQAFNPVTFSFGLLKSLLAIYLIFLFGRKTVPFLFRKLALYDNRELLLISAFLFCLAVAGISTMVGLSFAIGSFIAGMLLSTTAVNHEVFTEIRPLRDLFSSVFFVSLGFLISISGIYIAIVPALLLSLLVIIIKIIVILGIALGLNYYSKIAFYTAFALFEVGEFGFILANIGLDEGILQNNVYQVVVLTSIITITLTPFIYSNAPSLYRALKRTTKTYAPKIYYYIYENLDSDAKMPRPRTLNISHHVILIGYGRVGKYISNFLDQADVKYVVVDMHYKTLLGLRKKGIHSVYGDAVNLDVLKVANLKKAKAVIIASPDFVTNELILKNVRRENPEAKVVIRSQREEDIAKLSIKGVKHIVEPEFEASVEISSKTLKIYDFSGRDVRRLINSVRKERKY